MPPSSPKLKRLTKPASSRSKERAFPRGAPADVLASRSAGTSPCESVHDTLETPAAGRKAGQRMSGQWIVLVEATDAGGAGDLDQDAVGRLLAALDRDSVGSRGGALHCADRYALQLSVIASGPAEALVSVLCSWADALRELDLPAWKVVRTEVLTPGELERDQRDQLRKESELVVSAAAGPRSRGCRRRRTSPPRLR